MMEDMEKQCNQPWRLMSTCTMQFRGGPRLWKAHNIYNEGKVTIEGMTWIIHFFDLFRSGFVLGHFYAILGCLAKIAVMFSIGCS